MEKVTCIQVGMLTGGKWDKLHDISRRVYSPEGLSPALHTMGGGNTEIKIMESIIYDDYNSRIKADQNVIGTITPNYGNDAERNGAKIIDFRIRKLTPKECFRLMDFDDEDVDKCVAAGISNSQLYKQAGNSIVVACLEAIFRQLL